MGRQGFFFVVDDAGFGHANPDGTGPAIEFAAYENLLSLAREFDLRIPLGFTLKFIDLENLSGIATPVFYVERLLEFVREHATHLELASHGLTHEYEGTFYEFFEPFLGTGPTAEDQEERAAVCSAIWESLGFETPSIFVPPSHGWQPGITDRAFARQGARYLISLPRGKVAIKGISSLWQHPPWRLLRPRFRWEGSGHLDFLPRSTLGLNSTDLTISLFRRRLVRRILRSERSLSRALLHRQYPPWRSHSFMTHIGNFATRQSLEFWRELLRWIEERPDIDLLRNNEQAVSRWKSR